MKLYLLCALLEHVVFCGTVGLGWFEIRGKIRDFHMSLWPKENAILSLPSTILSIHTCRYLNLLTIVVGDSLWAKVLEAESMARWRV